MQVCQLPETLPASLYHFPTALLKNKSHNHGFGAKQDPNLYESLSVVNLSPSIYNNVLCIEVEYTQEESIWRRSWSIIEQRHWPLPYPFLVVQTVSWNYELIICCNILCDGGMWCSYQLPAVFFWDKRMHHTELWGFGVLTCIDCWATFTSITEFWVQVCWEDTSLGWISIIFPVAWSWSHNFFKAPIIIVQKRKEKAFNLCCTYCQWHHECSQWQPLVFDPELLLSIP